jgi:hypothetical protein
MIGIELHDCVAPALAAGDHAGVGVIVQQFALSLCRHLKTSLRPAW